MPSAAISTFGRVMRLREPCHQLVNARVGYSTPRIVRRRHVKLKIDIGCPGTAVRYAPLFTGTNTPVSVNMFTLAPRRRYSMRRLMFPRVWSSRPPVAPTMEILYLPALIRCLTALVWSLFSCSETRMNRLA